MADKKYATTIKKKITRKDQLNLNYYPPLIYPNHMQNYNIFIC